MSVRNFRVHERKDEHSHQVLLDSRNKAETLMFESGAVAELSKHAAKDCVSIILYM